MMRRFFALFVICAALLLGVTLVAAQETYTVQLYDVLDLIAASYDVDTLCLAQANDLKDPGELRVGQTLVIDLDCPRYRGPAFVPNPRESADQGGGQVGDADQGGGDAARPQPGPDDQTYRVEPGDTLDTIAQQFNISVISLTLANGLSAGDPLMADMELIIPSDAPAYGEYPALVDPTAPLDQLELGQGGGVDAGIGDQVHVVQLLDVLDLIGAAYDADVACIAQANQLDNPSLLFAGQTLVIPADCPGYQGEAFVANPRDGG